MISSILPQPSLNPDIVFQGRINMKCFLNAKQYSSSAFTKSWYCSSSLISLEFVGYSTL